MGVMCGMRRIALTAVSVTVLTLSGCVRSLNDDSAYVMLPESGWVYGDMITFNLTHIDSVSEGSLTIAVSHDSSYLYSNLWLEISSVEDDNHVVRDTVEFQMADSAGNWRGTGLTPEIELEMPVGCIRHVSGRPNNVRYLMRCDTLRGMSKIGLFFRRDLTEDETQ